MRVQGYDYAGRGGYFVTICTHGHTCLFGEAENGSMALNALGEIVREEWFKTADVRPTVFLDTNEIVVMPNHIHGILWIMQAASVRAAQLVASPDAAKEPHRARGPQSGTLGAIIGQFKSLTTKRINAHRGTLGARVWQRNYYEHVIRRGEALARIRQYILQNPACWEFDQENRHRAHGNLSEHQRADRYPW